MDAATLDRVANEARPRLVSLAYRMLGSVSDAEDVVQDALLRAYRSAPDDLDSPVAYLTTITTRLAIDHLRSARVRRESYVGPWLPEPLVRDPAPDVSAAAEQTDGLSMAFLVLLETLSPEERAVLVLHDVFGYSHAEIAATLDRSEAGCRQLLRRARQRVGDGRRRFDADEGHLTELVSDFVAACAGGGIAAFLEVLGADVTYLADGGAGVKAARYPIRGRQRVARLLAYLMRRAPEERTFAVLALAGGPAVAIVERGRLDTLVVVEPGPDGRIGRLLAHRNPSKLAALRPLVEHRSPPAAGR